MRDLLTPQFTVGHAHGFAPWGFLLPPTQDRIGVPVFAQADIHVRVQPSAGPSGAWASQGSREAAEGAAYYLRRRGWEGSLRATLHCPLPRRLFAARSTLLLGAVAAARAGGYEPSRDDLADWAADLRLGWDPQGAPGALLGAWLLSVQPHSAATWESPEDPRLAVRAARTREALVAAAPALASVWAAAESVGAAGIAFDPQFGHVSVIFEGGNAPPIPAGLGDAQRGRVGLGFAWS